MSNTSFMNFKMSFELYERKWTKYIRKKRSRCRERLLIKRLFFFLFFFSLAIRELLYLLPRRILRIEETHFSDRLGVILPGGR